MMKRKMLSALASIGVAGLVAACAGATPDGTAEPVAPPAANNGGGTAVTTPAIPGAETEIRMQWWGDTGRNEIYDAIIAQFEAENPGITVLREPASWGDYWTRLSMQAAGGNAPTLFGMHPQFVSDYAPRGALADLGPFVANGTIDVSEIAPAVIESGEVNGTLFMLPQGITYQGFIANPELLESLGVNLPGSTEDWTWEQFVADGITFAHNANSAGENVFYTFDQTGSWIGFRYFQRQDGGDIFTADGDLGATEQRLTQWFTMWNELRAAGALPTPEDTTEDTQRPLEQRMLTNGQVGMQLFPANQLPLYQAQSNATLDMVRVPITSGQSQRGEFIEGAYFAIAASATPAEQEAAARLISFWLNSEDAIDLFMLEQGVPANPRLAGRIMGNLSDSQQKAVDFVNALNPISDTAVYPPMGAGEIDGIFQQVAERVAHGLLTPAEAAAEFVAQASAVLDR